MLNPYLQLIDTPTVVAKNKVFIVKVGDKMACSIETGKVHEFKLESTAQAFAYQLSRGFFRDTVLLKRQRSSSSPRLKKAA